MCRRIAEARQLRRRHLHPLDLQAFVNAVLWTRYFKAARRRRLTHRTKFYGAVPDGVSKSLRQMLSSMTGILTSGLLADHDRRAESIQALESLVHDLKTEDATRGDWVILMDTFACHGIMTASVICQNKILELDASSPAKAIRAKAHFLVGDLARATHEMGLPSVGSGLSGVLELRHLVDLLTEGLQNGLSKDSAGVRPQTLLYRGSRVALVGQGEVDPLQGEYIDSFDVVARLKDPVPGGAHQRDRGQRCDVVYATHAVIRSLLSGTISVPSTGFLPALWVGPKLPDGVLPGVRQSATMGFNLFCKPAGILFRSIVDIASADPSEIGIFGVTLYAAGMGSRRPPHARRLSNRFPLGPKSAVFPNHELPTQQMALRQISTNPVIRLGTETAAVASLTTERFAQVLTREYSNW